MGRISAESGVPCCENEHRCVISVSANQIEPGLCESLAAIRATLAPALATTALEQQRLYEQWLRREEWRLRTEALPLLCGLAPAVWAEARLGDAEGRLWEAVNASRTAAVGLPVVNPDAAEDDWRVRPADCYHWARAQGITLPAAFEELIGFILCVVKGREPPVASPAPATIAPGSGTATVREQVLGAALNVLAKCPDQCYDEHGLTSGERIADRIQAQSLRWFDAAEPPMPPAAMASLIDQWLE